MATKKGGHHAGEKRTADEATLGGNADETHADETRGVPHASASSTLLTTTTRRARPRKHASSAASVSQPVPAALPLRDLARETAPTRRSVHRAPARRQAWPRRGRKDDNSIQANSEQQLVSDGGRWYAAYNGVLERGEEGEPGVCV